MKLHKTCIVLILALPIFIQAQYLGGNGRGDVSIILTNVPLPVKEIPNYSPANFDLKQNYPNPFNPLTKIKYTIPLTSKVQIKVFDVLGNEIATLINEEKTIGNYEVEFDALNFPSGVYLYQLRAGDFVETKKMLLLK